MRPINRRADFYEKKPDGSRRAQEFHENKVFSISSRSDRRGRIYS
jgi:hypothetical protein